MRLGIAIILIISGLSAQAGKLIQLQSGTAAIASGGTINTVTVTSVNTAKSILFFSYTINDATPGGGNIAGELLDSTTLRFIRNTGAATVPQIRWYLAEFESGVNVQRGSRLFAAGGTIATVVLPTPVANLSKSFVVMSHRNTGSAFGSDDFSYARLLNTGTLEVRVNVTGTGTTNYYQVVEYDATSVQRGTIAFATTRVAGTAAISAVNTNKTYVTTECESADGTTANIGQKGIRADLESATSVVLTRQNTGQFMTCYWQAIEFLDRVSVERGSVTLASNTLGGTVGFGANAVSTLGIPIISGPRNSCGSSTFSTDDNIGVLCANIRINSSSQGILTRNLTGAAATFQWGLIRFPARVVKTD